MVSVPVMFDAPAPFEVEAEKDLVLAIRINESTRTAANDLQGILAGNGKTEELY